MAIVTPLEARITGRRVLSLKSPVDLQPIGQLVCASAEDVTAAVARARQAQPGWAALSFAERAAVVHRVLDLLLAKQDTVVATVIRETGKAPLDAYNMEVFAACDALNYYAKNAGRILKTRTQRVHGVIGLVKQLKTVYRPLGVVGIITPWNGPFILAINPTVQALMAGNAVILKGSEVTPESTRLVGELFREAGLPDGVLQVLMGDGEVGAALCTAGVDKVSFTGSVATGRKVAMACAAQLIPCSLELGGKDAMIVCADADLDRAADGALVGSCMNTGHYCCGTERIYVEAAVYEPFLQKVLERARHLKQGAQFGADEDVGAVFWDRQLEIIERHVADAVAKGAKVPVGGRRNPDLKGLYFEPTVVTDVTHDMLIMREETFGPVACIMKVANVEEAIRLANDSPYGLNGNVWTRDKRKGFAIAQRIDTGSVCVNDMAVTYGVAEAPFGGRKESGVGQVNGETGLKGYCHAMPVVIDRFGGKQLPSAYPYSQARIDQLKKIMQFLWGSRLRRRFS